MPTLLLVGLVAPPAALAAAGREIRFTVINGMPCARGTVRCGDRSIPANVVIDLGLRAPVLLHKRTAELLRLAPDTPVELTFGDVKLTGLKGVGTGLEVLERLTQEYSAELGELPAVAILGLPGLKGFTPQLELGEGLLRLLDETPRVEDVGPAAPPPPDSGAVVIPFKEEGHGVWLPAQAPGGFALRARFSTGAYDTAIDATAADLAGAPGGELDELLVGSLNIARYVALRPEDLSAMPAPRADITIGTNLLSHFRVTIDANNRVMTFEETRKPRFPEEERRYFVSVVKGDAAAIEGVLDANPSSRLAAEAAERLLGLRLDASPPDGPAIRRAVRRCADAARAERRATRLIELGNHVLELDRPDRYELATHILTLGLDYAPTDQNTKAVFQLHSRLGLVALRTDDLNQARRHLLSAAFGLPKDPQVNAWMGEYYERSGKPTRAWSRYVQAILDEKPPPEAMRGLDRLNRDPAFRAGFSMADAEELLEGRMLELHPPDRFGQSSAEKDVRPVRLVELFSCIDHPPTLAAEVAFAALAEYYAGTGAAFVQYHLPAPETDPLVSDVSLARAAVRGVKEAPVVFFDGVESVVGGGSDKEMDKVYEVYKSAARVKDAAKPDWQVGGKMTASDGVVRGEIELTGPESTPDLRLHILLCEKAVMAPGACVVLMHRQVARAAMSPPEGFEVSSAAGRRTFAVSADTRQVTAALENTIKSMEQEKSIQFHVKPTYVDPAACRVVAFLENSRTKKVLAAGMFDTGSTGAAP